jgi:hypothetical protein
MNDGIHWTPVSTGDDKVDATTTGAVVVVTMCYWATAASCVGEVEAAVAEKREAADGRRNGRFE